jgi:hypothetical protein
VHAVFVHELPGEVGGGMFHTLPKYGTERPLYWALTIANPPIDLAAIIESFEHYLEKEGNAAGRAEFIGILEAQCFLPRFDA